MSSFQFSHHQLTRGERRLERFFEILPGLTSWSVLIGMVALSYFQPVIAALAMVLFNFYWLLRLFYLTIFLMMAYLRLSLEERTNWSERIAQIDALRKSKSFSNPSSQGWKKFVSNWIFRKEIKKLTASQILPPAADDIYHLVIVPAFKESYEVLEPGVASYAQGSFSAKKILMVFAIEDRASAEVKKAAEDLKKKYRDVFFDFLIAVHPQGLEGEACVKGANATYAAKISQKFLEEKKIPVENVIVSCFDADTVVSANYFACLTYYFMVCPNRERASFQPIPVYHNNIWAVPGFARILEMGASFFQLTEATHPDRLVTFSSHSMSFKALVEVNYWPVDMVSDDSAIFWKAFIHYQGDYRAVPMYVTLSMDVVDAGGWWQTCVNVYKQKRRWAWGVENFPIVMRGFLRASKISWFERIRHSFKLFEGHIAWATWPFILGVMGWLPTFFSGQDFSDSVVYYTVPRISSVIFNLASLSLGITIILSLSLLPRTQVKYSFLRRCLHALEWLLIPVVAIFFSAMPALDAQTRLMLGKYMEFWVTDKRR